MVGRWLMGEAMPQESNRITLKCDVRDRFGLRVPNVHFNDHQNYLAMREHPYAAGGSVYDAAMRRAHSGSGRGLAEGLQGHAGQRGAVSEQPVLDLGIAGGGVCRAGLLVVEVAARHPCVRIRADGQPCLGHRGE